MEVEPGTTTGDFLQGFLRGTRSALSDEARESITISVSELDARALGALIALFERAVTFYASLINVNAYHQPGVEAGKKAAGAFLDILGKVRECLKRAQSPATADQVATEIGKEPEVVYHCLSHLSANGGARMEMGSDPASDRFLPA